MNGDLRGWRLALLADTLLNPQAAVGVLLPDVLDILKAHGYGLLQLPPAGEHRPLLAVIADQVAEYAHHGYAIVAIGVRGESGDGLHWRSLAPLLRHRGTALPPRHILRPDIDVALEAQRLAALLARYDVPIAEQQRWRV